MLVTGLVLATGGGAFLAPLLASGCLFGSKNKAVKYAEEAPSRSAEQPSRAPEKMDSGKKNQEPQSSVSQIQGIKDQQQPSQTSANDKPSTGDGSQSARPASGGANNDWNPVKEIEDIANALSGEANALTLLEPIGQGGFGTVFRGSWRNLEVAVKTVMFSEPQGSEINEPLAQRVQQRAIMEAAVCTSVMHPNVVATYHYDLTPSGEVNGQACEWKLYLVQEYCNASLYDALKQQLLHNKETKVPDMDLVLSILIDIAKGLIYIHAKNIIHGDLTPGNILLKKDPTSPIAVVAKITDFGLCTTMDPNKTHVSNVSNGTPYYVAPEVVTAKKLTKTSDVYSFGVLMWEVYRCMPPWVKTKTGYRQNPRFRRFPSDSPHVYVVLCARCLDKNPKVRPNFTEVLAELQAMHTAYLNGYSALLDLSMTAPPAPLPAAFADTDVHVSPAAKDDTAAAPTSQAPPRSQLNIGD